MLECGRYVHGSVCPSCSLTTRYRAAYCQINKDNAKVKQRYTYKTFHCWFLLCAHINITLNTATTLYMQQRAHNHGQCGCGPATGKTKTVFSHFDTELLHEQQFRVEVYFPTEKNWQCSKSSVLKVTLKPCNDIDKQ